MKNNIVKWLKNPDYIILIICFIVFVIIGVIDHSLIFMMKLFLFAFFIGILIKCVFYLKDKFF